MLCRTLALTMLILPAFAQSNKAQSVEELVSKANRALDAKVLRGLSKLAIGSPLTAKDLTENDSRKLIFDTFARYNVPVTWTSTAYGYAVDIPTVFIRHSVTTTTHPSGQVSVHATVYFELFDKVKLVRDPDIVLTLPVWSIEEVVEFDPSGDRDSTVATMKRLAEKFCLSPRPQNLWVGDGPCGLLRAPQLIRKTSVFNGFQGVLNMLRTSYESSANWSSNSKVMPLQQE